MTPKTAKARVLKLRAEIERLRTAYHVKNDPTVTDEVYDSLTKELQELLKSYPEFDDPTASMYRVAGKPLPKFEKVRHTTRLLSLDNAFSFDELAAWEKRNKKLLEKNAELEYFSELKFDGLAISLVYENGKFIRGATRGDGEIGEDITENLKMIESVPLSLIAPYPTFVEVRGEGIMRKATLSKLNAENTRAGRPLFANSRNAAAGSLRQLDPALTKARHLDFFAYEIASVEGASWEKKIATHAGKHEVLQALGFQVDLHTTTTHGLSAIFDFISRIEHAREKLPFGIDGVVVSINATLLYQRLGVAGKAPRAVIAYKYPAEKATTVVLSISTNVGRTGILTPLAHFRPTEVAGSTVAKATLHNIDQIRRLDVRVGDTVVIQKAGDVIPEVVEVLTKLRSGKEKVWHMPKTCPVCMSEVEKRVTHTGKKNKDEERTTYYCSNRECPAKNIRSLEHFVNIFEIYEIGPKVLLRFKEEGLISDAADLFLLTEDDLSGLSRFGEKSAKNIIDSIRMHRKVPLWRFIYALGILHVGEQTAKDIATHFKTLPAVMKATPETIQAIPNIGPVVSKSLYEFFQLPHRQAMIRKLLESGVSIEALQKTKPGRFTGRTFVITGTLPHLSRDEAKALIEKAGGKVASAVSKETSFVLAGENPGSKYQKAQSLGVSIIDEPTLRRMMEM